MLTCSRVHVFTCSRVHVFTCSRVHVFTCSRVHVFTCSRVHVVMCSRVHVFTCSRVHVFTCSRVHVLMCSDTERAVHSVSLHPGLPVTSTGCHPARVSSGGKLCASCSGSNRAVRIDRSTNLPLFASASIFLYSRRLGVLILGT